MDMMLLPLKRYADFNGRSRRAEYWMFALGIFITEFVFGALFMATGGGRPGGSAIGAIFGLLYFVVLLGLLIPSLAVTFRRLHDTDRSAWWILIAFIPLIGAIALLVFYCLDGTPGPNKFGPDPKGRGGDPAVFT